jgi:CubicO group peptidase (beta-lactamase class C family)
MTSSVTNSAKAFALITLGLAIGAMGVYVGEVDDAPGAGGIGLLLMLAGVWLGVKAARNRLAPWAGRTALAIGVIAAAFAAALTYGVSAAAPLFARPADVPSVAVSEARPAPTTTVDRARSLVRSAMGDENLPGVSVAVGIGTEVVWAEGFGWRDVGTRTPVTPATRFNIGTAASVVTAAPIASLGMTNTGTDQPFAWSPEAIGEPGEDFPVFTLIRRGILQPIGLVASEYPLPGDRATFYVPRSDDNDPRRGRRLMFMRDLACCADDMAFYSTPSDLVRFALATGSGSVNGDLAGGTVMSLVTRPDKGVAVAVTSNVAHANTADLARSVAEVFAAER